MQMWKSLLILPAAAVALSTNVMAADATGTASVTVNAAINVTAGTPMDFGAISNVSGGECSMAPADGSLTGGATDSCAAASGTPGTFTITSTNGNLDVTVSITTAVSNDVTFAPVWNDGSSDIAAGTTASFNNASGSGTLNVGGKLTNGASVGSGATTSWNYNVNVVYP